MTGSQLKGPILAGGPFSCDNLSLALGAQADKLSVVEEAMTRNIGANTLYSDIKCPRCGKLVKSGIGFRAGTVNNLSYKIGEMINWDCPPTWPGTRPADGNLKTIGYFECDNLNCETWQDCYPEVQEALIIVKADIISDAKPYTHKPNELGFDVIEPDPT